MIDPAKLGEVARARRELDLERLVEKTLLDVTTKQDVTYGELLLAAGRVAARLSGRRPLRDNVLGIVTAALLCVTVIIMTWLITH